MANPSDGSTSVPNCTDGIKTWDQIDTELHNAGYGGPIDHGPKEIAAYQSAAKCTPCIKGFNEADCTGSPGAKPPSTDKIVAWIKDHPIESAVGGLAFVLLVVRH